MSTDYRVEIINQFNAFLLILKRLISLRNTVKQYVPNVKGKPLKSYYFRNIKITVPVNKG